MPSEAIAPPLAALPRPWPCQIVRLLKDCPGQAKPGFGGQAAVAVARSVRHSSSARLRSGAGWHAEPSLSAACHAKPKAQGNCSPPIGSASTPRIRRAMDIPCPIQDGGDVHADGGRRIVVRGPGSPCPARTAARRSHPTKFRRPWVGWKPNPGRGDFSSQGWGRADLGPESGRVRAPGEGVTVFGPIRQPSTGAGLQLAREAAGDRDLRNLTQDAWPKAV